MRLRGTVVLLAIMIMTSMSFAMFTTTNHAAVTTGPFSDFSGLDTIDESPNKKESRNLADVSGPLQGILNPVTVEQAGYYTSDNITGRTDTGENTQENLLIDAANGWVGSQAEIDIYSLERLYAVNGSFDTGIGGTNQNPTGSVSYYPDGWTASSSAGANGDDQFASYEVQSDPYVTVVNQALEGGLFTDYYDHFTGSYVIWRQTIDNSPFTTDFMLSFNYLYFSGILYSPGGDNPGGDAWLIVAIDGAIRWNVSLLSLDTRNIWNSTGDISLSLPSVGSTFTLSVGIYIEDGMRLYADRDYDNNGVADGLGNVASFIVHLDDVSLVGQSPPDFDAVELQFKAGSEVASISGSAGVGFATISNPSLWTTNPLSVEVLSNTSVRVEYRARLLSHRFINSSWTTDAAQEGTAFSIDANQSPRITAFAYVGIVDPYEDFYVNIIYPDDWENVTVFNPFLKDVTSNTTSSTGITTIPTETLSLLGWWNVVLEAPNYIKQLQMEIQGEVDWQQSSLFRIDNSTRARMSVGTSSASPILSDPVNVTWFLPNDTVWIEQQVTNSSGSTGVSDALNLGPYNTSAGQWTVVVAWTNGSQIGYASTTFDFYRTATLSALNDPLNADHGTTVSNFLHYQDEFTGEYLLEGSAVLTANWSTSVIAFVPNLVRNWYEADFDTGLLDGGSYVVNVNASLSYYDDVSISFVVTITYEVDLAITSFSEQSIEVTPNKSIEIRFNYTRSDGVGVKGADVSVSYTSSDGVLNWSGMSDYNNGTYALNFRPVFSASYTITITLSKAYHYSDSVTFSIFSNDIPTDLSSSKSSATISIDQSVDIRLHFTDDNGIGILGATIEVRNQPSEISILSLVDAGNGYYNVSLASDSTGAFDVLFRASLTNYENSTTSFSLLVTLIPTEVRFSEDISSIVLNYSEPYEIFLFYERTDLIGNITSSSITVTPSDTIDLVYKVTTYGEYYGIELKGYRIGIWQLTIIANKSDHRAASRSLLFEVRQIGTQLNILNIGSLPVERGLNESFEVRFEYQQLNSSGIVNASIDLSYSSSSGLYWSSLFDYGNGTYSIQVRVSASSTYSVTLTASKEFFTNAFDSFIIVVEDIPTQLVRLNGTSDTIRFGESYSLQFRYTNSSGYGLSGASITVVDIEPSNGLTLHSVNDEGDGYYSIVLIPDSADVFTLILEMNRTYYEPQFLTFTLLVSVIPATLQLESSSAEIAIDQSYTVLLSLEDDEMNGISGAFLEIVNEPEDIDISAFTDFGNGTYSIILAPETIRAYDLLFRATLANYQVSTEAFSLLVTEIPTQIILRDDITGQALDYGESYQITLFFIRTDLNENITGAIVRGLSEGLNISVSDDGDYYTLRIVGYQLGRWQLSISANKTNHRVSNEAVYVTIESIDTVLEGSNPGEPLTINRAFLFNFSYLIEENRSTIVSASIDIFGDAQEWVSVSVNEQGEYEILLIPADLGPRSVTLEFSKVGYESKSFRLSFTVEEIPLEILFESGTDGLEGATTQLVILLREADTREPVSGATVSYLIFDAQGIPVGEATALAETDAGRYETVITIPDSGSTYSMRIYVQDTRYVISGEDTIALAPEIDINRLFVRTAFNLSPILILLGALVIGLVVRTIGRRREMKLNQQALTIKRRFDDARNILGLIVIHRSSGLPIYSRMLRGGIEEGMVSAFITAIRNFRMEFAIAGGADEGRIFPISDIIRVVSTKNLITAFITVDSPSVQQRERMLSIAAKIGGLFDDAYSDTPLEVIDAETRETFDAIFDEEMDIKLLRRFRFEDDADLPDDTQCVEEGAAKFKEQEFLLEQLAEAITECGFDENRAYLAIMNALDEKALSVTAKRLYTRVTEEESFIGEVENLLKAKKLDETTPLDDELDS